MLFDTLDESTSSSASRENTAHTPIKDFTIIVDKDTLPTVRSIVTTCKRKNNLESNNRTGPVPTVSDSSNYADICYQLCTNDRKLAEVIHLVGPCTLVENHAGFDFLIDAIIGQQLSKKAADAIIRRFRKLFSSGSATPKRFISLPRQDVLKTGISNRKYDYILDLAQKTDNKQLRFSQLHQEDDATIRRLLKEVKGIGDWTVDMYLLFGLARLDVFPVHDLALRKVMSTIYDFQVTDLETAKKVAHKWMPYRSIASWYLYKFRNMPTQSPAT